MATIVDSLIEVFNDPNNDTTPEALQQHIRDYVNSDSTGDIQLSDEIKVGSDRFNDLYNGGDFSPRHAPDMRMLSNIVTALKAVKGEQEAARADLDNEFADAAATMADTPTPDTASDQADPSNDDEGSDETDEGSDETDDQTDPAAEDEDEGEGEAQTASAVGTRHKVRPAANPVRLPSTSSLNSFRNQDGPGNTGAAQVIRRKYSIVAAADVPRTTSGSSLSMRELAEATNRRFSQMPVGQRGTGARRASIALVKRTFDNSLETFGDNRDRSVIDSIAEEKNLPGGSLLAAAQTHRQALTAAGCCTSMSNDIWCSPSETDYTLCEPLSSMEGMVDLPTVPVSRGGIRYPVWTQLPFEWHGQVVDNSCDDPIAPDHFEQPENYKTCISGPCPEWAEVRLSLEYLCIEGDILRETSYPELTERFLSDSLTAHAHFMNHKYLSGLWDGSDLMATFDVGSDGLGSVSDSLVDRLGLLLTWMRERYKMPMGATLEAVAPVWLREYIKLDLARKANRSYGSVTDAEIEALFADYTTRVQWVYDTEGIVEGGSLVDGSPVGGRPMPGAWPNNAELLLYPAGSWVLGQQDIITLDALYDSEKLKQNKYTSLFTEEGFLLLNRCNRSFRVRLENLCRSGGVASLVPAGCAPDSGGGDGEAQTLSAQSDTSGSSGANRSRSRSARS